MRLFHEDRRRWPRTERCARRPFTINTGNPCCNTALPGACNVGYNFFTDFSLGISELIRGIPRNFTASLTCLGISPADCQTSDPIHNNGSTRYPDVSIPSSAFCVTGLEDCNRVSSGRIGLKLKFTVVFAIVDCSFLTFDIHSRL